MGKDEEGGEERKRKRGVAKMAEKGKGGGEERRMGR